MNKKTEHRIREFLIQLNQSPDHKDLESLRLLLRERSKKSLWFTCRYLLEYKDVDSELHKDMTRAWQLRRQALFSLWLVPRGHLKTSVWTEGGTIWEMLNDVDQRAIIINAKLENAVDILANIRAHFETKEILRWLFPEYCIDLVDKKLARKCKWGVDRLDFPNSYYAGRKEGNIAVMGVEASLVSKHCDLFVHDDPVNDVNTTTRAYRNKVDKWYKDSLQLRHDPGKSRVRLVGTRWHLDDLYGRTIKAEREYRQRQRDKGEKVSPRYLIYHRKVIEEAPDGKGEEIIGRKNVRPIWPQRFTKAVIEETRSEVGSYIFSCQYLNEPVSGEQAVFKYEDIKIIEGFMIPENVTNFAAMDLAVSDKDESDFSVITVASFDNSGNMYVRECFRKQMLPREALDHVERLRNKWNCSRVGIENVAFQDTVYRYYQEICQNEGWNIPWVQLKRSQARKSARFMALQPRVERGQFYIEEGIQGIDEILDEMTSFSLDHLPPFDDILDTLADLEQIYYKAGEAPVEQLPKDTFAAFQGLVIVDDKQTYKTLRGPNPLLRW